MKILWNYLKPHRSLVFFSLLLAAMSQVLTMIDPVIFGKIIDEYASNPKHSIALAISGTPAKTRSSWCAFYRRGFASLPCHAKHMTAPRNDGA